MPDLLIDVKFFEQLFSEDQRLAEQAREAGCPHCGGRLHQAHYPRKVRGIVEEAAHLFDRRFSFCCAVCRRRQTPASLRFLGRRVFAAAVLLVAAVVAVSVSLAEAARRWDVAQRTLRRWRQWFQRELLLSDFWKRVVGQLQTPPASERMPISLLEQFGGDNQRKLTSCLRLLRPLSSAAVGHELRRLMLSRRGCQVPP